MDNKIIFGQYYPSSSWLHRLDPRTKIVSLILLIVSLFLVKGLYFLLGFMAILFVLMLTTKVPIVRFFRSIRTMSFILLLTFILQILFNRNGSALETFDFKLTYFALSIIVVVLILFLLLSKYIKYFKTTIFAIILFGLFSLQHLTDITPSIANYTITIYKSGLYEGLFVVLRVIALLFISSLLTLTTKPTEINNGLESLLKPLNKIGIKTSALTMIISIALRFVPTLILEADKILKAQASRGADFSESSFASKIIQVVSLIIPMIIITYKKAADLGNAMEARGYNADKTRSSIYILKYRVVDILTYIFVFLILAGFITLRIL